MEDYMLNSLLNSLPEKDRPARVREPPISPTPPPAPLLTVHEEAEVEAAVEAEPAGPVAHLVDVVDVPVEKQVRERIQISLPANKIAALKRRAYDCGVAYGTLASMYVAEKLNENERRK